MLISNSKAKLTAVECCVRLLYFTILLGPTVPIRAARAALEQAIPDLVSDQRRIDLPRPTRLIERTKAPRSLLYPQASFRFPR